MSRRYDSSSRKEQAKLTRRRILDAAVDMHGRGITTFESIAAAARVSLPTVRKHFPNKESMFEGCTAHFFASFEPPALEAAAALADARDRVPRVTAEMCRAHETIHDLVWHSYAEAAQSPTIAAVLAEYEKLVRAAAEAVVDGGGLALYGSALDSARRSVEALLHPLTYRAFRVHSGLDADTTRHRLTMLIGASVGISIPD